MSDYQQVTVRYSLRYGIPCMAGCWKRNQIDGKVDATYTPEEMTLLQAWGLFDLVPKDFQDEPVSRHIWKPQPAAAQRRRL